MKLPPDMQKVLDAREREKVNIFKKELQSSTCLGCGKKGNCRYYVSGKPFCNLHCHSIWEEREKERKTKRLISHLIKDHGIRKGDWTSWESFDIIEFHNRLHSRN